jgi:hypothetical protein
MMIRKRRRTTQNVYYTKTMILFYGMMYMYKYESMILFYGMMYMYKYELNCQRVVSGRRCCCNTGRIVVGVHRR